MSLRDKIEQASARQQQEESLFAVKDAEIKQKLLSKILTAFDVLETCALEAKAYLISELAPQAYRLSFFGKKRKLGYWPVGFAGYVLHEDGFLRDLNGYRLPTRDEIFNHGRIEGLGVSWGYLKLENLDSLYSNTFSIKFDFNSRGMSIRIRGESSGSCPWYLFVRNDNKVFIACDYENSPHNHDLGEKELEVAEVFASQIASLTTKNLDEELNWTYESESHLLYIGTSAFPAYRTKRVGLTGVFR